MNTKTVEIWGAEDCEKCRILENAIKTKGLTFVRKNFDEVEGMLDSTKKLDLFCAYQFEQSYPVLYYHGHAFTPVEFMEMLGRLTGGTCLAKK